MRSVKMSQFKAEMLVVYSGRSRAKSTVRQVKQVLDELVEAGVDKTGGLTEVGIDRWLGAWPDRTPATSRSHMRCLRRLCKLAVKAGYLRMSPFTDESIADWVPLDSRPPAVKRLWSRSPEEVRAILALLSREARSGGWVENRDEAYFYTLICLGARAGEIQRLGVEDFDPRFRTLTICAKWVPLRGGRRVWWRPKTFGSAATLAIGDRLSRLLTRWLAYCESVGRVSPWLFPGAKLVGPWTGGGPGVRPLDRIRSAGERAGVVGASQKMARKGVGTHAALIQLEELERTGIFRHRDREISGRYDEQAVESRRPAAVKIESFYFPEALHG
jgi:integrase